MMREVPEGDLLLQSNPSHDHAKLLHSCSMTVFATPTIPTKTLLYSLIPLLLRGNGAGVYDFGGSEAGVGLAVQSDGRIVIARAPEHGVLHRVVREHLQTFLWELDRHDEQRGAPLFVKREFQRFVRCGVLAHGFARFRCTACGTDRLVAFSCKGRGFGPSCGGRRMTERAAHLIDAVLPRAPVRQWVLSLPFEVPSYASCQWLGGAGTNYSVRATAKGKRTPRAGERGIMALEILRFDWGEFDARAG